MTAFLWQEYTAILIYIIIGILVSIVLLVISWVLSTQKGDAEKVSAYECGFSPFADTRRQFDVRFYLVAILFIIFDLEVSFLFPWSAVLGRLEVLGYWSMFVFLTILTAGFAYEWKKGAIEWQ